MPARPVEVVANVDERVRPDRFWSRLRIALDRVPEADRTPPAQARVGAVLVLLEDTDDGPSVVLTRRRRDLRSHPGQVSFAGGRVDADETVEQAALREAHEEVGLRAETVEVLGSGPCFYIPPSRFWVVPVVACWREPHELAENPWEVDEVLRVPLTQLLDRDRWRHTPLSSRGSAWAWQLDGDLLWGATAVVMSTLLDVCIQGWNDGMQPHELGADRAARPWETAPAWQRRARLEGDLPSLDQASVPHVTREQHRAVRAWLDSRGVDGLVRAEGAGRGLAYAVRRLRGGSLDGAEVTVLAGPSSNGAAGLAAARLLATGGARVHVLTVGEPRYPQQTHVLRDGGVPVAAVGEDGPADDEAPGEVVVDAMLGIGAEPPLTGTPAAVARWLARYDVPIVALDLPSGLSADVGLRGACIPADVTVALGLPTVGLREPIAHPYLGDVYLADLGVPHAAWSSVGVELDGALFGDGPLVRLTDAHATDAGTPDQGAVEG